MDDVPITVPLDKAANPFRANLGRVPVILGGSRLQDATGSVLDELLLDELPRYRQVNIV